MNVRTYVVCVRERRRERASERAKGRYRDRSGARFERTFLDLINYLILGGVVRTRLSGSTHKYNKVISEAILQCSLLLNAFTLVHGSKETCRMLVHCDVNKTEKQASRPEHELGEHAGANRTRNLSDRH